MRTASEPHTHREPWHIPVWLGLCLFLAIAVFFLWEEHRAHFLGALPYVLLLLCPVIHLFMHRGHGGHAGHTVAWGSHGSARRRQEDLVSHDVPAYGLWSLVIINAAVFILFAFSLFKPRTTRDKALEMALKRRRPEIGLPHHSDQGCTYASAGYQTVLDAHGIIC